jgi:hypothetical protein
MIGSRTGNGRYWRCRRADVRCSLPSAIWVILQRWSSSVLSAVVTIRCPRRRLRRGRGTDAESAVRSFQTVRLAPRQATTLAPKR